MKLFEELRRRNVLRVAAGYVIAAWLTLQVTDVLVGLLELPSWAGRLVFFALLLGFPLALVFSWLFQFTPQGLKRQSEIDTSPASVRPPGRKFDLILIVLLVISLGYFVLDKYFFTISPGPADPEHPGWYAHSVAVIPFVTRGDEAEGRLFADSVHDDLLTQLSKIGDLHVISRTSVMEYADTTKKIPEIGAELSVKHILEGGVQKVGDQVRINVQLIDAETDRHLWAETYDRGFTVSNIFNIQTEIVQRITQSLHAALLPSERESIGKTPTENLEAYRDYVSALHTRLDPEARRQLLESAVEKDPGFALAWIELADDWQQTYWWDPEQPEALDKSLEALAIAEALDPDLPQLHVVKAMVQYHGFINHEEALKELDIALKGMPGNSEIFEVRGTIYRHMGRLRDAIEALQMATRLDPRNAFANYELGLTYAMGRYYNEARRHWDEAILKFPDYVPQYSWHRALQDWFQYGDSGAQRWVLARPDWPDYPLNEALVALKAWQDGDLDVALWNARNINFDDDEQDLPAPRPGSADMSLEYAELIQAGVLIAGGFTEEAHAVLERSRARIADDIEAQANPHWYRFGELASVLALLGRDKEALEAAEHMLGRFDEPNRTYQVAGLHLINGILMCQLGMLTEAEEEFRWVLSRPNEDTLASLVNQWPPCTSRIRGTEHYERLDQEFGHLSNGQTL